MRKSTVLFPIPIILISLVWGSLVFADTKKPERTGPLLRRLEKTFQDRRTGMEPSRSTPEPRRDIPETRKLLLETSGGDTIEAIMPTKEFLYTFSGHGWKCPPTVFCIGKGPVRMRGKCGHSPVRAGPIPTGLCMVAIPREEGSSEKEMAIYVFGSMFGGTNDEISIVHVK
jgi:hypothetical protein